ncbi:MAG TPA: RdgB/HAM1 family non-canonical purine NTP pyrophosphatase [Rhabdochlamydiaceae bacterium]|nr:RdgB/HAM1 family non-canonical purine NTP pyrophosphatase [Rhabdochlamydiaceae bacterium]
MKLVIASRNVHKIREFRAMLKGLRHLDIYSLIDFPQYQPPPEVGKTFEENAIQKAIHAASALGLWALADDSGLVIPALGGAPGIHSARYAGDGATDKENRKKLLQEMRSLKDQERAAYFECCLALASPKELKKSTCACCEGTIIEEEKGRSGFGYDPIFQKHEYSKTFGELEEEVKNRISHRRKAMDKILLVLETIK